MGKGLGVKAGKDTNSQPIMRSRGFGSRVKLCLSKTIFNEGV